MRRFYFNDVDELTWTYIFPSSEGDILKNWN